MRGKLDKKEPFLTHGDYSNKVTKDSVFDVRDIKSIPRTERTPEYSYMSITAEGVVWQLLYVLFRFERVSLLVLFTYKTYKVCSAQVDVPTMDGVPTRATQG